MLADLRRSPSLPAFVSGEETDNPTDHSPGIRAIRPCCVSETAVYRKQAVNDAPDSHPLDPDP